MNSRHATIVFCFLTFVGICGGCAEVHVKRLLVTDKGSEGIRFYQPHPYLLVTLGPAPKADGKDGKALAIDQNLVGDDKATATSAPEMFLNFQIIFLPKIDEIYAVTVKSGLGTAEGSVKLKDGWMLTEFGGKSDSKIPETITAASGLLTSVAGVIKPATKVLSNKDAIGPGLYRFEFDTATGFVKELVPVTLITKSN